MLAELIRLMMAAAKTTDEEKRGECQKHIRGMCHVVAVGGEDQRGRA